MTVEQDIAVAVVLLTLDQCAATLRCLESLRRVTRPSHRIVLWDNGSTDDTVSAVQRSHPGVVTHHHSTNLGVASGRNAAVELAIHRFDPELVLFLDNDMEVEPDFLVELAQPFAEDEALAQTTGKILQLGDPGRLYGAGGCYVKFWSGQTGHVGYGEPDDGAYDRPTRCLPSGGCMLVRTRVFRQLHGFDTRFDPYGPEDLDFGLRARAAGYYGLYVPQAVVYHEPAPGHTFGGGMQSAAYVENKSKLWFRFMSRHATIWQWVAFCLLGAPLGLVRMTVREAKRGNLKALIGVLRGALGPFRSKG